MKVLIDSSTLYSAIALRGTIGKHIDLVIDRHTCVLSDYIIEEMRRNIQNKLPDQLRDQTLRELEIFISNCDIKYKQDYFCNLETAMRLISEKDPPILACGMLPDIDYLLTSDKEFLFVECDEVTIISPKDIQQMLL